MKRILFLFLILFNCAVNAQLVIDNTTQTPQQLVQSVVVGQGINVSNIKFNGSAASANTVSDQVGLFTNGTTTNIGIDKGIILSTGNSAIAIGPNDRDLATLPTSNPFVGDNDLYILSNNQVIKNVAILEFDFVPTGNNLNFNFVFASEEYPEFVNDTYNDNFGFFLSGPGITGPFSGGAKNIALIPSTTLPVSINNLNNGNSNTGPCEYCPYYVNNEGGTSIQYDGFTKVLAANADVECGQTYHIKLAIANVGDNNYDSAVFIEGASFSSSGINLGNDVKLCSATDYTLKTGLNVTEIHEWRKDGIVIPTEIGPNLLVTQTGTYSVKAFPFGVSCPVSDEIKVEFNTVKTPVISCGVKTTNSIQFNWGALTDATAYSVSYQVESNTPVNIGSIGNITTYTVNGLNSGEIVKITVTPIGIPVDCFSSASQSCSLVNCVLPTLSLTQGSALENGCISSPISDIVFTIGGGATSASIVSGNLPSGVAGNLVGNLFTISGAPTASGTFNFTVSTSGGCTPDATLSGSLIINTNPTFTAVAPVCEGTILSPLPIKSNNNITGSWFPTLNNTATTEYTFTPDGGQCANPVKLTITVNSTITPTFSAVAPICEGTILSPLPIKSNNNITGSWFPSLNNTTTTEYTFTPDAGQCANPVKLTITVNPIMTPTFSAISPICEGTILSLLPIKSNNNITGSWSPALNNTATTEYTFTPDSGQCANSVKLTITVNPIINPTFTAVAPICEGTILFPLPIKSNNNIAGSWSPALNNIATTEYTFTPDAGQCANSSKLTITVNPIITPTFSAVAPICEGTILSPLPIKSNNNITGSWSPAVNNIATTEYTFTPDSGQCANSVKLTIIVNPIITPIFTVVAPICEGTILSPLQIKSNNNITGSWSPALNNVATTEYTFTPDSGQCANPAKLIITVSLKTIPTFTAIAPICEGEILTPLILQSNNNVTGSWSPALNNLATTEYTFTPDIGQCATQAKLTITVNPKPTPLLKDGMICIDKNTNAIIQSYILDSKLNDVAYNFEWFLNGNKIYNAIESTLETIEKGTYAVIATNKITNCTSKLVQATVTETFSNSTIIEITQTNAFTNDATVTISILQGTGAYEYQLDQGEFQLSNIFSEVPAGTHTINVRDTDGCTDLTKEIVIIGYPKFFTPNGDGHNEIWNIIGFSSQSNPAIYIFDRYGKLLKQINSTDFGWDGTYNGHQMPATDYWFKVIYFEDGINKEFKSHFSLKR